jgi:RimJ/RimL family protein N-acetyltransferase
MPDFKVESDADGAFDYVTRFFNLVRVEDQKGIVLRRDGVIVAAALFVEYNGTNIFIHLAGSPGRRWLTRDFLYWIFHYPFIQLGCRRVSAWVESNNADSVRFIEHLGATREATLEKAARDGDDVYIYRMFREDCKYV